jgi:hypothetical protein
MDDLMQALHDYVVAIVQSERTNADTWEYMNEIRQDERLRAILAPLLHTHAPLEVK